MSYIKASCTLTSHIRTPCRHGNDIDAMDTGSGFRPVRTRPPNTPPAPRQHASEGKHGTWRQRSSRPEQRMALIERHRDEQPIVPVEDARTMHAPGRMIVRDDACTHGKPHVTTLHAAMGRCGKVWVGVRRCGSMPRRTLPTHPRRLHRGGTTPRAGRWCPHRSRMASSLAERAGPRRRNPSNAGADAHVPPPPFPPKSARTRHPQSKRRPRQKRRSRRRRR